MKIEILFPNTMSDSDYEYLSKQGVCLDDFDYALIFPSSITKKVIFEEDIDGLGNIQKKECYNCNNHEIDGLLTGSYNNKWYKVKFRGKKKSIGIAYHG